MLVLLPEASRGVLEGLRLCSVEGSAVVVRVCRMRVLCSAVKYTAPSGARLRCLVVGAGVRCASPPRTPQRGLVRGLGCCRGTRRREPVRASDNTRVRTHRMQITLHYARNVHIMHEPSSLLLLQLLLVAPMRCTIVLCPAVKYTAPSGTRPRCLVVGAGVRCGDPPRAPRRGLAHGPGGCRGTRRGEPREKPCK